MPVILTFFNTRTYTLDVRRTPNQQWREFFQIMQPRKITKKEMKDNYGRLIDFFWAKFQNSYFN